MENVCKSKAFEIVVLKNEIFLPTNIGVIQLKIYVPLQLASFYDTKMMKEIVERYPWPAAGNFSLRWLTFFSPPPPHYTVINFTASVSDVAMDRWQRVVLAKYLQICSAPGDYITFVYK